MLARTNITLPLAGESSVSEVRVKWLATPTAGSHNETLPGRPFRKREGVADGACLVRCAKVLQRDRHRRRLVLCPPVFHSLGSGRFSASP